MNATQPPTVLVIAGNDPSGGAGLCADIQALANQGCHTAPVVTCLTIQNTHNIINSILVPGEQVAAQAQTILVDIPIAAVKIGLLGSVEIIEAVQQILIQYPHLPVILDPILAAGGGYSLASRQIRRAIIEKLLPFIQVITPNSQEARALTGQQVQLESAAKKLIDLGCDYVCITGTHENTAAVINTLYHEKKVLKSWKWPRLAGEYHGSGCTFAASLAGLIAKNYDMITAVYQAQRYTWTYLQQGYQPAKGQFLPNRISW